MDLAPFSNSKNGSFTSICCFYFNSAMLPVNLLTFFFVPQIAIELIKIIRKMALV